MTVIAMSGSEVTRMNVLRDLVEDRLLLPRHQLVS